VSADATSDTTGVMDVTSVGKVHARFVTGEMRQGDYHEFDCLDAPAHEQIAIEIVHGQDIFRFVCE